MTMIDIVLFAAWTAVIFFVDYAFGWNRAEDSRPKAKEPLK